MSAMMVVAYVCTRAKTEECHSKMKMGVLENVDFGYSIYVVGLR